MSYAVPTPDQLADLQASELEQRLRFDRSGNLRMIDARSPRSVLSAIARSNAMALYGTHLHLRWIADQVMPDTCDADDWLARHGNIWGVPRRAASFAIGTVQFSGTPGTALPSGLILALSGQQWTTTAAATLDSSGSAVVAVQASTAGLAGNMPSGTKLAVQTPLIGLSVQSATVSSAGITGGADIEAVEDWRQRIIQRIRTPAHGGASFDYIAWAKAAVPVARVACIPNWVGLGTVGVPFAMTDPSTGLFRTPTSTEIASMTTALAASAPVTAQVIPMAATLTPVNVVVQANPNTASVLSAVSRAIAAFFIDSKRDIGMPLHLSMLSDAISLATGEAWHRIVSPSGDLTPAANELYVAGTISVVGVAS
jgi:uncharacterized phage protein gp47/JayE